MTPQATRVIRAGLLATVAAVAGLVTWSLQRAPRAEATAATPAPDASPVEGTHVSGFQRVTFERDRTRFEITARTLSGSEEEDMHLTGVEVRFQYTARGTPGDTVVKADEAQYTPAINKIVFRGNVQVDTADGFSLRTSSLVYRGDKQTSRSDEPVAFSRKDLSGTSTGMVYQAEEGLLDLPADVVVRLQDPDNAPMEIRSARASASKAEGLLKFVGHVEVTQGNDRLKAQRFLVNLGDDHQTIYRAQAQDDVDFWMGGGARPGMTATVAGEGARHITGRKLDLWFRPNRTLQEATAGPDAVLVLMPAGKEPDTRTLKGRFLGFSFDEEGRLSEVRAQKDAEFRAEPPKGKGETRTLTCQSFVAKLAPRTGQPTIIDFSRDVVFTRGAQKATANKAYYDGARLALFLEDDPVARDAAQDTELKADVIRIGTHNGDVAANDNVRHVFLRKTGGGLLSAKDQPTVMTAEIFEYSAARKTGQYRTRALLRSGADEVQAEEINVVELPGGKRRLEAKGKVVSRMSPAAVKGKPKPAAVEGRAGQMVYDEAKGEIAYEGEVVIRQGDIETKSPRATLALGGDGGSLRTLVAGEPVEVRQGARTASGSRATYTPADETMMLVGERVVLKDPTQEIAGRSLTFHVGDDRILVDGREEIRTQMIIRK
jgi:LPS export ABC transporter protein LptC/lipopolysaccharide transport protein LptA